MGALGPLHQVPMSFNCSTETPLSFKLQAVAGVSSSNESVIKLHQSSKSAEGIGIQVLYNNEPVTFNKVYQDSNTNASTRNLDIQARYYQLESKVNLGGVEASMKFTIIYS